MAHEHLKLSLLFGRVQLFCGPIEHTPSGWLLCPWYFPVKSTGVGCHFLLQGIFPTQGLDLLGCRQIRLPAEPPGKPSLLLTYLQIHRPDSPDVLRRHQACFPKDVLWPVLHLVHSMCVCVCACVSVCVSVCVCECVCECVWWRDDIMEV